MDTSQRKEPMDFFHSRRSALIIDFIHSCNFVAHFDFLLISISFSFAIHFTAFLCISMYFSTSLWLCKLNRKIQLTWAASEQEVRMVFHFKKFQLVWLYDGTSVREKKSRYDGAYSQLIRFSMHNIIKWISKVIR